MEFCAEIHLVGLTNEFTVMDEVLEHEFGILRNEELVWQGYQHLWANDIIARLNEYVFPPLQLVGSDDGEVVTFAGDSRQSHRCHQADCPRSPRMHHRTLGKWPPSGR